MTAAPITVDSGALWARGSCGRPAADRTRRGVLARLGHVLRIGPPRGPDAADLHELLLGTATRLLRAVDAEEIEREAAHGARTLIGGLRGARAALLPWPGPDAPDGTPVAVSAATAPELAAALGADRRIGELLVVGVAGDQPRVLVAGAAAPLPSWAAAPLETLARQTALALDRAREADRLIRHKEEERFRGLVRCSTDLITVLGEDGRIRYQSPSVERVLGHRELDLVGTSLLELLHPEDAAAAIAKFVETADRDGLAEPVESRWLRRDGSVLHAETVSRNLLDDPELEGFVLTTRDVTERKLLEARLTQLAFHDPLTGLPNRALLADRLRQAFARCERSGTEVGFLVLDVDDFKAVNDGLGHAGGDALLVEIARRLAAGVREVDTVARLGGDEFAILVEGTDAAGALELAKRVRTALREPFAFAGRPLPIRTSIGVATGCGGGPKGSDELLRRADVAMYAAKQDGGQRCELFRPGMYEAMLVRLEAQP